MPRLPFLVLAALLLGLPPELRAQEAAGEAEAGEAAASEEADAAPRLPDASETRHSLTLAERTLEVTAKAGAITLKDQKGKPEAEIGYVAYSLAGGEPRDRPVTFAVNGGPGAASAYLHLGAIGPWRVPLGGERIVPSRPPELVANDETWLAFTDLVFVDPAGTGFSRLLKEDETTRERYFSVDGDIAALADFIYRWVIEERRTTSPLHFVGESYGGFRGPLLADQLATDHGLALSGLTLVSPVLDFGWREQPAYAPLPHVSLLPSLAAAAMEEQAGSVDEAELEAVEAYATGSYVSDLLEGIGDEEAVARIVRRVAALTGIEEAVIERQAGRLGRSGYSLARRWREGRIISAYDTAIVSDDPAPEQILSRAHDPAVDAMNAPLTRGMLTLYGERLDWLPERRYRLLSRSPNQAWDWGDGRTPPEAVSALRRVMALDPALRLLVVHGYTDLVTPYFESALILRQLPDLGDGDRVRRENYGGGHMFYTRDASRAAFRDDARRLYRNDEEAP